MLLNDLMEKATKACNTFEWQHIKNVIISVFDTSKGSDKLLVPTSALTPEDKAFLSLDMTTLFTFYRNVILQWVKQRVKDWRDQFSMPVESGKPTVCSGDVLYVRYYLENI